MISRIVLAAALLLVPLASAQGNLVDTAYEEATRTADHHQRAISHRLTAESTWSASYAQSTADHRPGDCFAASAAYAGEKRRDAGDAAADGEARADALVREAGAIARGEQRPFAENGTLDTASDEARELRAAIKNGSFVENASRADREPREEAVRAAGIANDAAFVEAPCHAFARSPASGGHAFLVREDAPAALAIADEAVTHATGRERGAGAAYALIVARAEAAAHAAGVDPYAPLAPAPGDLNDALESAYADACAALSEVTPCL